VEKSYFEMSFNSSINPFWVIVDLLFHKLSKLFFSFLLFRLVRMGIIFYWFMKFRMNRFSLYWM
jgi:hypothetical protein